MLALGLVLVMLADTCVTVHLWHVVRQQGARMAQLVETVAGIDKAQERMLDEMAGWGDE